MPKRHAPVCHLKDGVLQAIRLMAERRTKSVLALDESESVVGVFRLDHGTIVFVPSGDSSAGPAARTFMPG